MVQGESYLALSKRNLEKLAPVMWSLGIIDDFLFEIEAAKQ